MTLHSDMWQVTFAISYQPSYHMLMDKMMIAVEAHCYLVITSKSILMSKYVAESINQNVRS